MSHYDQACSGSGQRWHRPLQSSAGADLHGGLSFALAAAVTLRCMTEGMSRVARFHRPLSPGMPAATPQPQFTASLGCRLLGPNGAGKSTSINMVRPCPDSHHVALHRTPSARIRADLIRACSGPHPREIEKRPGNGSI